MKSGELAYDSASDAFSATRVSQKHGRFCGGRTEGEKSPEKLACSKDNPAKSLGPAHPGREAPRLPKAVHTGADVPREPKAGHTESRGDATQPRIFV
jgi:hypothetical protein